MFIGVLFHNSLVYGTSSLQVRRVIKKVLWYCNSIVLTNILGFTLALVCYFGVNLCGKDSRQL